MSRTAPEPDATVRLGRLAIARLSLLLGAVSGVMATLAGMPVLQLLPGGVPSEPMGEPLTAQTGWALLGVGMLITGNTLVAGEFRRIDWTWPAEELR
jgi:hypothetical protein